MPLLKEGLKIASQLIAEDKVWEGTLKSMIAQIATWLTLIAFSVCSMSSISAATLCKEGQSYCFKNSFDYRSGFQHERNNNLDTADYFTNEIVLANQLNIHSGWFIRLQNRFVLDAGFSHKRNSRFVPGTYASRATRYGLLFVGGYAFGSDHTMLVLGAGAAYSHSYKKTTYNKQGVNTLRRFRDKFSTPALAEFIYHINKSLRFMARILYRSQSYNLYTDLEYKYKGVFFGPWAKYARISGFRNTPAHRAHSRHVLKTYSIGGKLSFLF